MSRAIRALAVAVLALAGGIGTTQVAAADEPGCTVEPNGYVPGGPCEMKLTVLPVCPHDTPLLTYEAVVEGSGDTTTDIVWHNPTGDDLVLTDQPLAGTVVWPGTVLDGAGVATDWPGWTWNGTRWVEGDAFDWATDQVQVTFTVSPSATATVAHPGGCAPTSTGGGGGGSGGGGTSVGAGPQVTALSETGLTSGPLVVAAAGLLGLGALLVLLARRRGRTSHV